MEIKNKVVVVTGGAEGIGAALCRRFAREGAKGIVAADINEAKAMAVADEIKGAAFKCDVSREEEVKALVRFTEEKVRTYRSFLLECRHHCHRWRRVSQ